MKNKLRVSQLSATNIFDIESCCDSVDCPDCYLLGTIEISKVLFHAKFCRMRTGNKLPEFEGQYPIGIESERIYRKVINADTGGNFRTMKVPGFQGKYVCIITPFQI